MADPATAVSNAAAKFAAAETGIQKAIDSINKLPRDFKDVHDGETPDMQEGTKPFGYLEMSVYASQARAIAGMLADAQLALFQLHQAATDRARELGIDPPQILGGGGR